MTAPTPPTPSTPDAAAPVQSGSVDHPAGGRSRFGPPHRWTAVLRAEMRKTTSVKLWWVLVAPIVLVSLFTSGFGTLLSLLLPSVSEESPIRLMVGVASAMGTVSIIAAVFGALLASGEFRHRTATLAFLTGTRGQVLGAKVVVAAVVGALYGLIMAVLGPLLGGAALGGQTLPGFSELAALGAIGMLVCALWAVIGAAIGTVVRNQVGSLAITVGYLALGEALLSFLLQLTDESSSDPTWISRITAFLPGNAGDAALYGQALAGAGDADTTRQAVEFMAGASAPPPSWVCQLVLVAWTVAFVALAGVVGGRRDVT